MTIHLKRSDNTVKLILDKTFPNYTGQHISATITDKIQFIGTMWDEGNKTYYKILRLTDMTAVHIADAPFLRSSSLHSEEFIIPVGFVVVAHHYYGRRQNIRIIGPAENINRLLPKTVSLTPNEEIVLIATRSVKASYAGISNYRWVEANRYVRITQSEWDLAKQSLVDKGFLQKNGAITVDGRNAVGMKQLFDLRQTTIKENECQT